MKFLMGMICGLVVAIVVPVAVIAIGAASQGDGPPLKKSKPLVHNPVEESTGGVQ